MTLTDRQREVLDVIYSTHDGRIHAGDLTQKQREVLALLASGQTTKQAGGVLGVSPKTIDYHRAKLMKRLGIHDLAGLVRYAMHEHLIS